MKKKLGIVVIIMLLLTGVTVEGMQRYKQHRQELERGVQKMYGTENYLGPMSKKVKPLTEKEIKELNPNGEFVVEVNKDNPDWIDVFGRCNKEKIEDIYDAREVACSVAAYLGRDYEKDMFLYGGIDGIDANTYWFEQYYKGVSVDRRINVTVDEEGNANHVRISSVPQEDIVIKSVEPKFTKEDIRAYMDEEYKEYEMGKCCLYLSVHQEENDKKEKKNLLEWEVEFYSENTDDYRILFNAQTGEVVSVATGEEGIQLHKQRMQEFEQEIQEMYGTTNYLGPLNNKVNPLTEQEIKELNPNGDYALGIEGNDSEMIEVWGKYNRNKIEDIYDAREVAYSVFAYFGRTCDAYSFIYGIKEDKNEDSSYDIYQLDLYYKGVYVGRSVDVVVDKDGNTHHVSIPKGDITTKSVEPQFTKADIISYLEEQYTEYEMTECFLRLEKSSEEREGKDVTIWKLVWEVEFYSENTDDYRILFDAQTGEVLNVIGEMDY